MYKALASASPFLTAEGDETPSKKCLILMSAVMHMFSMNSLWTQYFTKNWAYDQSFCGKYCTIKGGAQFYDFIADKSWLLLSKLF